MHDALAKETSGHDNDRRQDSLLPQQYTMTDTRSLVNIFRNSNC